MIKVLVIDDSSIARKIIARGLSLDPQIKVAGTAGDAYSARDQIVKLAPDVLTLDVEMPGMNGVAFLRKLMPQYPLPVIMVSAFTKKGSQTTLDALSAGAVDFVMKPSSGDNGYPQKMIDELRTKIKIAALVDLSHWKNKKLRTPPPTAILAGNYENIKYKVIAMGASTGGTEAIRKIVTTFPEKFPGTLIVQHMPPGFTQMYAQRLQAICKMKVKEAETGDKLEAGKILIAPGGKHMILTRKNAQYEVICKKGEPVNGHVPSIDVLFRSVVQTTGSNSIGIILTGMGNDGAAGLLEMRNAGAKTLAQDAASSVVFGMPKVAYLRGGAEQLVSLDKIPLTLQQYLR